MTKDRALTLLYNAIVILQEQGFTDDEIVEELSISIEELDEVFNGEEDFDFDEDEYLD
jgi:orotate phosphoribosyltransferase-like protein